MSLLQETYQVPEETARVARAVFPKGNLVMRIHDELGLLFHDHDFADLFPLRGQPAEAPSRLALATVLQFMEGLTDRQAADAVRTRIDWKYVLCLKLDDPGFHHTVLSEFRTRLLNHGAEHRLFEAVVELAKEKDLLKGGGRQQDSTHILGAMRAMNRVECVTETLRHTLNMLATVAPDWLRAHTEPAWVERYGPRASNFRLPQSQSKRLAWTAQVGEDGICLLSAFYNAAIVEPVTLPAVETLRRVWVQNFIVVEGKAVWRDNDNTPPAGSYIGSPYDTDARYKVKQATAWSGYKVYLSETCDDVSPNLITNVETTHAAVSDDDAVTETVHSSLAERGVLPGTHIADTGFVNSELFVVSKEDYGIELIGPTRGDNHWQAKAGNGFAARDFLIDWEQQHATCPEGKASISWTPAIDRFKNNVVKIKFSMKDCQVCPSRAKCTRSKRRTITVRPQKQHEALVAGRQREQTEAYKAEYARRAGIEGTIAQGVRSCGMRRSHYMGLAKTHLGHLMTATAINLVRMLRWLDGEPKAKVKPSAFERIYLAAA